MEMRNASTILIEKPEVKRLLGRPSHRRESIINMDLREVGCEHVYWINPLKPSGDYVYHLLYNSATLPF
jgi:hypothetical protein